VPLQDKESVMTEKQIYEERVHSDKTEALFAVLMVLFFVLMIWQLSKGSLGILGVAFLLLFIFFFFYSVNYRTLIICITEESLKLKFGIFTWTISLDNIGECRRDDLPLLMRYGGAGIHFMMIRRRYRASFNFLEHPRVVIALIRKAGIVQDISFSTRRPDEVIQLLQSLVSARSAA
jgi:Ca2+/Na+ antiporter